MDRKSGSPVVFGGSPNWFHGMEHYRGKGACPLPGLHVQGRIIWLRLKIEGLA